MRSSVSEDRTMMRTVQHFVYGDKFWFLMVPSFLSFLIQFNHFSVCFMIKKYTIEIFLLLIFGL